MNSSKDKSEIVTRVQEGERSVEAGHQKIDVRRRNIIAASLASGPVIMTITARPAGAVSGGSLHGSMGGPQTLDNPGRKRGLRIRR